MFKHLVVVVGLLAATQAVGASTPNSPDFDPVAHMRRFDPAWKAPDISQTEIARHPLGSKLNPVRAQGPNGQIEYLSRLRCKNGKPPSYSRAGMGGVSPYGFHLDAYQVKCGWRKHIVHMDFYHPGYTEQSAIPGFTLTRSEF
jgi:hypothetical protein